MVQTDKRWFGYLLVIIGATCWGVGGTVTQWLFQKAHLPVGEFVAIRLILSGVLLLIVSYFINGRSMMYIWSHKSSVVKILIYGLLGMLGVQFTFMSAIKHGNAAVATLLQYLGPIVIILYYVMRKKATFKRKEAIAILLALSGTFLLLTNGQLDNLSVPMPAIIWGLISAIALAFYTIYPVPLRVVKRCWMGDANWWHWTKLYISTMAHGLFKLVDDDHYLFYDFDCLRNDDCVLVLY